MRNPNNYIRIFMVLLFGALALNTTSVFANPMVIEDQPRFRISNLVPYSRAEATKVYQLPEVQAILATNKVCMVANEYGAGLLFYQASGKCIAEIAEAFRKNCYENRPELGHCLKMDDYMRVKPLTNFREAHDLSELYWSMLEYFFAYSYDDAGRYNRAGRAKGYYELAIKPDPTNGDKIIATLCIALKKIR